ncbi:unnamed protein product, partial [Darwinula stevensoni]
MKLEQAWSHMLKEVQGEQKKQPCDYDKLAAILKKAPSITQLAPLMLIKHPAIVHCIRKLREVKHNGVRKKSEDLYKQFKKLFVIPDGKQFVDVFQEKVKAFQEATKDMDVAKRFLGIGGEAALLSLLCKEKEAEKKGRAKDNVEPEKKDKDKGKGSPADMSPRKKTMLVKCASGDLVRVTCRNDLPKVFQNEEDEKFYEVRMKENMCCLESLLVRGVYIPPEVKKVMIERGDLSPDFKAHLIEDRKKWKKQVKLNWMKLEQAWSHMLKEVQGEQKKQPCDYDKMAAILKKAPSITQLAPLMLIKHPAIVHCIRKLREVKHNGVRKKSEDLYKQFKKLFVIPDGKQFVDVFQEKVKAF